MDHLDRINQNDQIAKQCSILFLPSNKKIHIAHGSNLIYAIRQIGLPIASSCNADGICALCIIEVIDGILFLSEKTPAETRLLKRKGKDATPYRIACQTYVYGDITITAGYW